MWHRFIAKWLFALTILLVSVVPAQSYPLAPSLDDMVRIDDDVGVQSPIMYSLDCPLVLLASSSLEVSRDVCTFDYTALVADIRRVDNRVEPIVIDQFINGYMDAELSLSTLTQSINALNNSLTNPISLGTGNNGCGGAGV